MKLQKLIIVMLVFITFPILTSATEPNENGRIVITQVDEDAIKQLLGEFKKHEYKVSFRSDVQSYLDCEAHEKLRSYGWKAVPYLIEQAARQEAVDAFIGSALIKDKDVKTPEQVYEYNCARKNEAANTLAPFILETVLRELPSGKVAPYNLSGGIPYYGVFEWVRWWQKHKDRFEFQTIHPLVIPPPVDEHSVAPHIGTSLQNGLLYVDAVSATYHQIIERAAAEMNIDIFVGEQEYIDVITTVRIKGMTFEEFLNIIGRTVCTSGFDYHKTETGYWVGGKNLAKPRAILDGWGIMMERTVFSVGDEIPVTIITRLPGLVTIIDPADPTFVCYGSFRVTTNDGKIVKDYNPVTKSRLDFTVPPIEIKKDCYPIQVLLNKFCKLPAGEYNIRFRYLEHETPSIAIEIYDRQVNRPPLK
jgi:hypothetical protein